MRRMTGAQRDILGESHYGSHLRLLVETEAGDFDDLSDWVDTVSWRHSIDEPIPELAATLMLQDTGTTDPGSLSPLMNLRLDVARRAYLDVATVPEMATPRSADWVRVFSGRINRIDSAQDLLTFTATGPAAITGTQWIEEETEYGSEDGRPIQAVMRDILSDWGGGIKLVVPKSPGFAVTRYKQQPMSVQDALQRLAALIGWIIIVKEIEGTDWLAFIDPERRRTDPQWAFRPHDYYDVARLDLALEGIRNAVTIRYVDGNGDVQSVKAENRRSIERYGRLWMEITEGDESPIDTAKEARLMLHAMVGDPNDPDDDGDLAAPHAEQAITTKFFWPAEVGDLYRFAPNGVHYKDPQKWAAISFEHLLTREEDSTTITVRGQPTGSYRAWRGRPGGEPSVEPEAFGNVTSWVESIGTFVTMYGFTASGSEQARSWGFATTLFEPADEPDRFGNGRYYRQPAFAVGAAADVQLLSWWFYTGPNQTGRRGARIVVEMPFIRRDDSENPGDG